MIQIIQQPRPINVVGFRGNPAWFTLRFPGGAQVVTVSVQKMGQPIAMLTPTITTSGVYVRIEWSAEQMTTLTRNPHQLDVAWSGLKRLTGTINALTEGSDRRDMVISADLTDPNVTLLVDYNVVRAEQAAAEAKIAAAEAKATLEQAKHNSEVIDWDTAASIEAAQAKPITKPTMFLIDNDDVGSELNALVIRTPNGIDRKFLTIRL